MNPSEQMVHSLSGKGLTQPPEGALKDRSEGFDPGDDPGSNAASMVQSTEKGLARWTDLDFNASGPLPSCVTLGKLVNFTKTLFSFLETGDKTVYTSLDGLE